MTQVLVLVPRSVAVGRLADSTMFVHFQTAFDAAIALKATNAPAVLVTDGLDPEDLDMLAAALHDRPGTCVEVRLGPWDGESHSPVSGACRGVISGFGQHGINRAIELLANG